MQNFSLRQEPRYEPASVIPLNKDSSILDWLKETNRLIPREQEDRDNLLADEVEISDLIEVEDGFDDDDEIDLVDED